MSISSNEENVLKVQKFDECIIIFWFIWRRFQRFSSLEEEGRSPNFSPYTAGRRAGHIDELYENAGYRAYQT